VALLGIGLQWLVRALSDVLESRPAHAVLAVINLAFLLYGLLTFVGLQNSIGDLQRGLQDLLESRVPLAPTRRQRMPSEPTATA
jgi:hypothetical protein